MGHACTEYSGGQRGHAGQCHALSSFSADRGSGCESTHSPYLMSPRSVPPETKRGREVKGEEWKNTTPLTAFLFLLNEASQTFHKKRGTYYNFILSKRLIK